MPVTPSFFLSCVLMQKKCVPSICNVDIQRVWACVGGGCIENCIYDAMWIKTCITHLVLALARRALADTFLTFCGRHRRADDGEHPSRHQPVTMPMTDLVCSPAVRLCF